MHVLIVGAGLGGLCLSQCLRKQGISFEVFERDENEDSRPQGWAIAIHTILDDLAASFPSDMPDLKSSTNHLAPLNLPVQLSLYYPGREGRLGMQDSPEMPIIRAERRRLRNWLATNIPVQWGKHVTSIQYDEEGASVFFKDGTSAKGDILVGADGINSVVREQLLKRPGSELLKLVPLANIVGELDLSGEAFKRQLELGHSAYIFLGPDMSFWNFGGVHHVYPDGVSGHHYWMFMQPDPNVEHDSHWLHKATQQEKLDYVLQHVAQVPPKFQEIFKLTPVDRIKKDLHIWRDLELSELPAGRIVLMGDAAHAMTPFRGEGGFHTFIDAMKLSKILGELDIRNSVAVEAAMSQYNAEMLARGSEAVRNSRNVHSANQTGNYIAKPLPPAEIKLESIY
ncbi:FAD/NAD(P)-binding domain-containing protein [Xylaria telfairii]|nr:FAD/NAD(P)-binding domain-containing protein [Xylaria telfairii]